MTLLMKSNSFCKVQPKNRLSSPKSVKSYLKELEGSTEKNCTSLLKPSISNFEENNLELFNSTASKNIVNALKNSSKGALPYPQEIDFDPSEDACDLKYIGDLSQVDLSLYEKNSFLEHDLSEEVSEEEHGSDDLHFDRSVSMDEELSESYNNEVRQYFENQNLQLLLTEMQLEKKRTLQMLEQSKVRREKYLGILSQVRGDAEQNWRRYWSLDSELRKKDEDRLVELQDVANTEIAQIEEWYGEELRRKAELRCQNYEAVVAQTAQTEMRVGVLLKNLAEEQVSVMNQLLHLQKQAEKQSGSEIYKILTEQLPSILEASGNALANLDPKTLTEEEVTSKSMKLKEVLGVMEGLKRLLANQKIEQNPDCGVEEIRKEGPPVADSSQLFQPTIPVSYEAEGPELRYNDLKAKFCAISSEADRLRENTQLRPLLARTVGIVNQLNNTRHDSSNRGKLQQLINLISGRTCLFGDIAVSTQNNPTAKAFVKEQLASKLVSLSHDIQVSTMAVYASLIVRLWQLYPDLGELILFKLYETCPFLVPMTVRRMPNYSEEEFNRSLGFRHKDGGTRESIDKYLTRMGSAANLYGRIVAIDVENHPHGICEGWQWFARTVSTPPFPSVTASIIYGFLSSAGYALLSTYRCQFGKLLRRLFTQYLVLMEEDVLMGGQSDVVSLRLLLEGYFKTGTLPKPEEGYKLLL